MLSLLSPQSRGELLHATVFQWHELWMKVLLTDLHACIADGGKTFESVKLLRRGIELFKLFDTELGLAENVLVREYKSVKALRPPLRRLFFSGQFAELVRCSRQLRSLSRSPFPGLDDALAEYTARFRGFRTRFHALTRATLVSQASAPSYDEWLHLPELFQLQNGAKADWTPVGQAPKALAEPDEIHPDENMFITIHQCFELWFRVILDHIDAAIDSIGRDAISEATHLLRHVVDIERMLVQQIHIPATMLPLDFARFRDERVERDGQVFQRGLTPASGTESYQFREIEIVCGLRDDPVFQRYLQGSEKLPIRLLTPRQSERLHQTTLPEAFQAAVARRGITRLDDLFTPSDAVNPNADLAELADRLIDLDEAFRLWRIHHVSMVEKMIGGKSGTGFLGPEYLMETAGIKMQEKNRVLEERQVRPRFFEDLWKVRSRMGVY